MLAVSSIYGIDILEDNAQECRKRLFEVFDTNYTNLFKKKTKNKCRDAVRYILKRNIIHGNALSLKTVGKNPQPIIFSEWSLVNGSLIKRRDFIFHELLPRPEVKQLSLFEKKTPHSSDLGEDIFIPEPAKEYPLVHFLEVAQAYEK